VKRQPDESQVKFEKGISHEFYPHENRHCRSDWLWCSFTADWQMLYLTKANSNYGW
jgi:hypothetical protein